MDLVNSVLEYFGINELAEQATFQDFMVYGLSLFVAIYLFVCLYRGIITMLSNVGKEL